LDIHPEPHLEQITTITASANLDELLNAQSSLPHRSQTQSRPTMINEEQKRDLRPALKSTTDRFSAGSQNTISTLGSSSVSSDGIHSTVQQVNDGFVNAAKKGDTKLLLAWINDDAKRLMLEQDSVDRTFLELSKNVKHVKHRFEAVWRISLLSPSIFLS
jgi:hypothetical protein